MLDKSISCRLGILCFGLLPLSAELILENTYPIDPPTGMSLYFAMSQIGSVVVIGAKGFLEQDVEDDGSGKVQVRIRLDFCNEPL